jgi:hypothetical protein
MDSQNSRFERYDRQTEGSRMAVWYKILDNTLVKERVFSSSVPNITSIGIGAEAGFIMDPWYIQSYEPYVIAGFANVINPKFQLTLIDADRTAIESVKNGKFIYLDRISLERSHELASTWLRMQKELGTTTEVITKNDGNLKLLEPYESTTDLDYMVSQGIERRRVPEWFANKISSGEISFINKDIRDVSGVTNQSLILCLNVLLHYPKGDQILMLDRISHMMGNRKLLVVNEGIPDKDSIAVTGFRKTLFAENGGWLDEPGMKNQFGLQIAERIKNGTYILEKII